MRFKTLSALFIYTQAIHVPDDKNQDSIEWLGPVEGELKGCTQISEGKCTPTFETKIAAQYHCNNLGNKCSGISKDSNGYYTTRTGLQAVNVQSWYKNNWCSNKLPSYKVNIPKIVYDGRFINVSSPVLSFHDLWRSMALAKNNNLNIINSSKPLTHDEYEELGPEVHINTDTMVFDGDQTFMNIKILDITARKIIVTKNTKITLKQTDAKPEWSSITAPRPSQGYNGINGENGASGFDGTFVTIKTGCLSGNNNELSFDIHSGDGSNGQHGSDGLTGANGVDAPDSQKMFWNGKRENVCCTFCGCEDCCHKSKFGGYDIKGPDCTIKGTDGGNGGNGGDSGLPGQLGRVNFSYGHGFNTQVPQFTYKIGSPGIPGNYGKGKNGGKRGYGGCGENSKCSTTGNGHGSHTSCRSFQNCDSNHKGAACPSNKNGKNGIKGITPSFDAVFNNRSLSVRAIGNQGFSEDFLDFLTNHLIKIEESKYLDEYKEILGFLVRYEKFMSPETKISLTRLMDDPVNG